MNFWQQIKNLFGQSTASQSPQSKITTAAHSVDVETEAVAVSETTPAQVQVALAGATPPLLLDIREHSEWNQVRVPSALHIPMNSVPDRLSELPRSRPIVVFCAHGSRSYGVAHYLRQQGFDASNLAGGITRWRIEGGQVNVG